MGLELPVYEALSYALTLLVYEALSSAGRYAMIFNGQGNRQIFNKTIRGQLYKKAKTQSKLYKATIHGKTNFIIIVDKYYYDSVYINKTTCETVSSSS